MNIKIPSDRKGKFLNYEDLAKILSERMGISYKHIMLILKETEDLVINVLFEDYAVNFKFGKLRMKNTKPRRAYDAYNGKHIITKSRKRVVFSESCTLKQRLKSERREEENIK